MNAIALHVAILTRSSIMRGRSSLAAGLSSLDLAWEHGIRICTMTHAVVHCEPGRPAPQRALSFTGNARGMALNMAEHQMVAFRDVDSCR